MQKKAKTLVVSIDHIYGGGVLSVKIIDRLRQELERSGLAVHEHSVPDIPRALLQGAFFLAVNNKMVGEHFWSDFQSELFTKAKVCDAIYKQMADAESDRRISTTVILCKNFNGTSIHGMLRDQRWYEDGMDKMELRARCGLSLENNYDPIEPDLNILLDIDPETAYQTYKESLRALLEEIRDYETRRKIEKLFNRMDFYRQRPAYLNEFERLGSKGEIVDANQEEEKILLAVLELIVRKIETM